MASVSSSQGETMTRTTVEGRKLQYHLKVLQQPERARACGCGVKSSADRRPVDPPPVCELKIFELGPNNEKTDITFSYNANFFLYASLELARPIAHGRVAPSTANQIPVLTGMPVSGMAYLDRPTEAGYFIFPDLSVRHEGKYKLQFNLYEETKDPKDYDPEEPKREGLAGQPGQNASFIWRLDVKSLPFTVYSAKKFPGLAESTVLSRTVAEQGCRVRIRRDVRMRRRDGKNSGEFDDDYEDYSRQRTRTPDPAYNRVRSMSNASVDRPEPYSADQSRRPSIVDYSPQSYQSNYSPANVAQQNGPPTSYLTFGAGSNAPQYQAPAPYAQPPTPSQPVQTNQQYQPPQTYDQSPASYRPSSASTNASHTTYNDRPYQSYQPAIPVAPRESHEQERRPSVGLPPTRYQPAPQYNPPEANYRNQPLSYQQPYQAQKASGPGLTPLVALAPIKMPPLEPRYESSLASPAVPLSANRMAPPLPSPFEAPHAASRPNSTYSSYATASTPTTIEAPRSSKRPFEAVFSTASYNQPLHNGMRPSSSHHNGPSPANSFDDDDDSNMEELKMQYKRADGSSHARALPNLQ